MNASHDACMYDPHATLCALGATYATDYVIFVLPHDDVDFEPPSC